MTRIYQSHAYPQPRQQRQRPRHRSIAIPFLVFIASPTPTQSLSTQQLPECWEPCANNYSGTEAVPSTDCGLYQVCFKGEVKNRVECGGGMLFNSQEGYCDYDWAVDCVEITCPPTLSPSESPTETPTDSPTTSPTKAPTASPSAAPTESPSETPTAAPTASEFAMPIIRKSQSLLEKYVFISYTASGVAYPSIKYTYDNFITALDLMANTRSSEEYPFYLQNANADRYIYGLINVAAFLANAMVESIQYDTCDELNWQQVAGRYAIANSCGQHGRSYQNEECGELYSCSVDTEMEITAIDSGKAARAPPPFTCRPGTGQGYHSGYWDTTTGTEIANTPYSSTTGRTDVAGCCWWGRGALLTRNVCNIGKANYYLGKGAAADGRSALYPNVDFCKFPEATCSSEYSEEMRWTVAMFEWAERVQTYDNQWSYEEELINFVNGGMTDDSFIMSVGRILTSDCHEVGCSAIEVAMADTRKANFYLIINDIFGLDDTPQPTTQPVEKVQPAPLSTPSTISTADDISENQPAQSSPISSPHSPSGAQPSHSDSNPPVLMPSYANEDGTYEPTYNATLAILEANSSWIRNTFALKSIALIIISALMLL